MIELEPNLEGGYHNRGASYHKLKDYSSAIKDYTKVIELEPNSEGSYYNRGLSYMNLKNYDLAIKDYTKAIELNPNDTKAYVNLLEMSIVRNQKFDKSLKENFVKLFSNDKQAFIY